MQHEPVLQAGAALIAGWRWRLSGLQGRIAISYGGEPVCRMALTLIRPTRAYRNKQLWRTRLPDGANAYPAYKGVLQQAIAVNP
ncbi:hypothetical protein [Kosakonia cowanii]|uniref:hypothetical protein n=1 Tax=Kosakonia cowanii TaxID=208223 RepID=UPI002899CB87|nr:hypothetical protein [Kosakonia cowanii]